MRMRFTALLALLVLILSALALTTATTGPANADITWGKQAAQAQPQHAKKAWGTSVSHASDDSGYTGDIHIVCENGTHRYLKPGQDTALGTNPGCSASGVNRIIVAYNQTVYCKNYVPPYENTYFYTGTNYVGSLKTYKCYSQRPL